MQNFVVEKEESGLKLLSFLKNRMASYSLKQLKRFLEENLCSINGVTERFAKTIVYQDDKISFKAPVNKDLNLSHQFLEDRILYEDADLFIYDKPSGMTSDSFKTDFKLIHRLDKETSGILMFAKNELFLNQMIALFRQHLVVKTYLAVVEGSPKQKSGIIDNYLGKKKVYEGQSIYGAVAKEKGLHAITEWKVEKSGKNLSLLSCYPKTGRTHQIRVHLSEMKHPILGDYHYCKSFKCAYSPKRALLHAFKISFTHPTTGFKVEIKSLVPQDMLLALKEMIL